MSDVRASFDVERGLVEARARCSESDAVIFDATLKMARDDIAEGDADRGAMLLLALCLVNLEQADFAYQQHLYPFDTAEDARDMALAESGCGLATEAIWRAGRIRDGRLTQSYRSRLAHGGTSYAVALEKDIAIHDRAWITEQALLDLAAKIGGWPVEGELLDPSDALIIGCQGCTGVWAINTFTDEHEFTVLYTERVNGETLVHSLDGGQGKVAIAIRTRKLVLVDAGAWRELWLASLEATTRPDGRPSKGRRLQGLSRASMLSRYS